MTQTLQGLIRSASSATEVRDQITPYPFYKSVRYNGDIGLQDLAASGISVTPWSPMWYPEASVYDVVGNRNASCPGYVAGSSVKPFLCMPLSPVWRYKEIDDGASTISTLPLLDSVVATGNEAAFTSDSRYLNSKQWVVNMKAGYNMNSMKSYFAYVWSREATTWNPFQAYSTLATYILATNIAKNVRVDSMSSLQMHVDDFVLGPDNRVAINPGVVSNIFGYDEDMLTGGTSFVEIGVALATSVAVGPAGVPDVVDCQPPRVSDYYFNQVQAVTDAHLVASGNLVYAPCFNGDAAIEPLIVFTTSVDAAIKEYPNYAMVTMPPVFMTGTADLIALRYALTMAILQPPLAVVMADVDLPSPTVGMAAPVRGQMYWNGGTHRIMRPRGYIVVLPSIGTDQAQTALGRTVYFAKTGSRDVLTVIPSDWGPAGTLIPANSEVDIPIAGVMSNIPASALIGSWRFTEEELLSYKDVLMSYWGSAAVYDSALDYLAHHINSFKRPNVIPTPIPIGTNLNNARRDANRARSEVLMTDNSVAGFSNYTSEQYWTRMGSDGRSRPVAGEEVMIVPSFDPIAAMAILAGVCATEDRTTKSVIHTEINKAATDKHAVLAWLSAGQLVHYDAAYERIGLPPALLMRRSDDPYCRLDLIAGGNAAEAFRLRGQTQFKMYADEMWTYIPASGVPVTGALAGYLDAARKDYVQWPYPNVPSAMKKLRPAKPPSLQLPTAAGATWCWINNVRGALQVNATGDSYSNRMEYGLLNGLRTAAGASIPLPLSSQGMFPAVAHSAFGRKFEYPDVGRRGTELKWSDLPPDIVATSTQQFGCLLAPTTPSANGHSNPAEFRPLASVDRFNLEMALNMVRQLPGFPPITLVTFNDRTAVYTAASVFGRPSLNSMNYFYNDPFYPTPVVTAQNEYSMLSMGANRLPVIDTTMAWLYIGFTADNYRIILDMMERNIKRPSGLQIALPTRVINMRPTDARNILFVKSAREPPPPPITAMAKDEKESDAKAEKGEPPPEQPAIPATAFVQQDATDAPGATDPE